MGVFPSSGGGGGDQKQIFLFLFFPKEISFLGEQRGIFKLSKLRERPLRKKKKRNGAAQHLSVVVASTRVD